VIWPKDPFYIFILNAPALCLGDLVYNSLISFFGNPSSPQAHYTIPWMFRIPQIYFFTSIVFWFIIGVIFYYFQKHIEKTYKQRNKTIVMLKVKTKKDKKNKTTFTFALSTIGLGVGMLPYALNIIDSGAIIAATMFVGAGVGMIFRLFIIEK